MKLVKALSLTSALTILLVGCGVNNNADERYTNDANDPLSVRYQPEYNGTNPRWNTRNDLTYRNNIDGNNGNRMGTNVRYDARDNNRNTNQNNNHNFDVADDIADEVTKLNEVDRAYVFVMGDNAYVAVKMNDNQQNVDADIEKRIADRARKTNRNIDDVFVSANPDFFDRMRGFSDDVQAGNPVSGFFNEFTETIERIFPTSR